MPASSTTAIAVLIVDAHAIIREAIAALLDGVDGVQCLRGVEPSSDLLHVVQRTRPDVVVFRLSGASRARDGSLALFRILPRVRRLAKVIVITDSHNVAFHAKLIELGATGVVSSDDSGAVLRTAVRKVHHGEIWLDRVRTAQVVAKLTRRNPQQDQEALRIADLTPRQLEIVMLVPEGLTNRQLAERLFISEATVRNHMTAILAKLHLRDRAQLTVFAFRRGLVA